MSYATLRSMYLILLLVLAPVIAWAQSPVALLKTGGADNDEGRIIRLSPNGNIVLAGYFHDTIDLDPGPASFELASNDHSRDIFVATYTQTGKLIWAFSIGSELADGVLDMTIAPNNDIYIAGYFKDRIDFDPSSDTVEYPCLGYVGTTTDEYGGDGFVAKYSSGGAFQWVVPIQSDYGEEVESVALDPEGNVYIGGQFKNVVDFDPSPSTAVFNSVADGTAFLAKYTNNGQYVWAHTFGKPGITMTDNLMRGIAVDAHSNIYVAGVFQDINNDFDPSPTNAAILSASGKYDALVAKYDKDGNYLWAINIQSESVDDALDIKLNKSGHLYVCGTVYGTTVDFDPLTAAGTHTLTNTSNIPNIFIAKYDLNGNYLWGKLMGSVGSDMGWALHVSGQNIYNIGFFSGPMDFNPNASPSVEVNSKGLMDLYVVKYDSAGNYKCHFTIGSSDDDVGRDVLVSPVGDLYVTGGYANDADFDLSQNEQRFPAKGKKDIMFARYKWDCAREGLPLKDTTVIACDTPFILEGVRMLETGIYGAFRGDTAIVVNFTLASPLLRPAFTISPPVENQPVQFTNESTGALAYTWDFGDGTGSEEPNPSHMYLKSGTYNVCLTIYNEVCTSKVCHVVEAIAEPAVGLPTGFSPNGDGQNDVLYVRGGAVKTIHLVIYNRWGQKIFETNDITQGWDGTYDGEKQTVDVVGYVLNATMLDGTEIHKSGNVTIIR